VQANGGGGRELVALAERSRLSEQNFPALQSFVVFDLGLTLLPVSAQTEAAQLLSQLVGSRHGVSTGLEVVEEEVREEL